MELTELVRVSARTGGWEWEEVLEYLLIQANAQAGAPAGGGNPIVPTDFDATGMTVLEPAAFGAVDPRLQVEPRGLLDIVREFANRIGWQLRPRWNAVSAAFELAFYEPPHAKATVDWYIPKDRYIVIPTLAIDRSEVRNAVRVRYIAGGPGGAEATHPINEGVQEDAASVAAYGFRFTQFVEDENSPINTGPAAQALADLFLADMAQPPVEMVVEVLMNFAVDIDDRITFEANDDHFDVDTTYAVVGYEHTMDPGRERTRLTLATKPTGARDKWRRRLTTGGPLMPTLRVTSTEDGETERTFYFERGAATDSIWVYSRTVPANSGEITYDAGDLIATLAVGTDEYTAPRPAAGMETHLLFEAHGADPANVGDGAQFIVSGIATVPVLDTPTHSEVAAVGTYGITVRDPSGLGTDLYYRTKSGPDAWSAWALKTGTPTDGAAYTETVSLVEGHQSYVEFRLDFSMDGATLSVHSLSAGMDFGALAHITSARELWRGDRLWVVVGVDSDAPNTGLQLIGRASMVTFPAVPTLASYQFSMSNEAGRFAAIDTGYDVANYSPGTSVPVHIYLRAIDIDGNEGPPVYLPAFKEGTTAPTATIDSFTHTKVQGGTACTTDPAQSSVGYSVTKAGSDTVTIERWVDGVMEATILAASTTASQTLPDDDHDFYEDPPAVTPEHVVAYRIIVKDSGGVVLAEDVGPEITFQGVVDCP